MNEIINKQKKNILKLIDEGKRLIDKTEYENSLEVLNKALKRAKHVNDLNLLAKCYENLGEVRFYISDYVKSMKYYVNTLKMYEDMHDKKGISSMYLKIGKIYANQNKLQEALDFFNKSLIICEEIKDNKGIAYAANDCGAIYARWDDYQNKAKEMFLRSAEISKLIDNKAQLSKCLSNLGSVEMNLFNFKKGLEYYNKALEIEKSVQCGRTLCYVQFRIAEAYYWLEEYKNMEHMLEKALSIAKECKEKNVELYCYIIYYTYYEKIEDYKSALHYHKLYSSLNEVIFNENSSKKVAELHIKYDTYKKEKEKEIYRLKNTELMELNEKLKHAYEELERISKFDCLTGLYNRRNMISIMKQEIYNNEKNETFTISIGDVDNFKHVNDTYGHDCGDYVLRKCSDILKASLRKTDFIARWGGEEFLIILPNTTNKEGYMVIDKLRKNIAESNFTYGGEKIKVTMTFGMGNFNGKQNMNDCIKLADKSLYKGKNNGKNCVCTVI